MEMLRQEAVTEVLEYICSLKASFQAIELGAAYTLIENVGLKV